MRDSPKMPLTPKAKLRAEVAAVKLICDALADLGDDRSRSRVIRAVLHLSSIGDLTQTLARGESEAAPTRRDATQGHEKG